jgi:hypothetical protein
MYTKGWTIEDEGASKLENSLVNERYNHSGTCTSYVHIDSAFGVNLLLLMQIPA